MRTNLAYANIVVNIYAHRAKQKALNVKEYAIEHKSELTCIAATTVVVGLTARVSGFHAGYEFANQA